MATRQFTTGQLLRRSLTPSSISGFLCVTLAIVLTIAHMVLLSVGLGTALPGLLDGQWAAVYTENVVQPLATFFANGVLNKLLVASLWGVVGLSVYMAFEYGMRAISTAKEAQRQVALNQSGAAWDRKPLQQQFLQAFFWRVGVIVLTVVFIALFQPLLAYALGTAQQVLISQDLQTDSVRVAASAGIWMLFFHCIVVILRLYTMRTRLFGDDKLY